MNPDFAELSEFRVHTPQSTALTGPGFNPFHPRDLFPDNNIEWWFQESGTPAGACTDEIAGPGNGDTKLKRAVADVKIPDQIDPLYRTILTPLYRSKLPPSTGPN